MRAVEFIDFAFDPLLGAKLSMCTEAGFAAQTPTKCSRRGLDRLAYVVDDPLHERGIVPLGHDADQRLRSRFADHETAPTLQLRLGCRDPLSHAVRMKRFGAAVEPHVLQKLG